MDPVTKKLKSDIKRAELWLEDAISSEEGIRAFEVKDRVARERNLESGVVNMAFRRMVESKRFELFDGDKVRWSYP